ncbi:PEP-utilizing enzyme [Streptosporangium sp. NBC_01810]|uniref:PEP/pyruvate-binding domain-containing protein n=1 Tax=Streptosporangium sp. NBC_01810 TaxID=2975951 RepID=UPI002DDA75B2|nr:PEP/pyruvate-binding domain-containing protein [Streptosporangium sp. NBC_01810]WSA23617.1 PEP-utilizing enzyme [Streptosporangium sp. NBC_01810]
MDGMERDRPADDIPPTTPPARPPLPRGDVPPPLILKFEDIGAEMLPLVGGKAANLGVLTSAGLPVPPGLCVTTEAYRRVTERTALKDVLAALATTPAGDIPALNALAAKARGIVLAAPVPDDIADTVRGGANGPVAVRSSATAEDLPHASFAGQQDTYLNMIGADAVLDAVRRCWASLWTDRAVAYRAANGIGHGAVRLAVVIQKMVQSETAGVMFTANPVTGRRHEAVIDASPGLGEAVVSGAVNPDHFVVDTATGRITERRLGDKLVAVRSLAGGGVEHVETPADPVESACITDAQLGALAELGDRVERHYRTPQDIEWAIDAAGVLWLTQARPITTLYPIPHHAESSGGPVPGDTRIYFCFSLAQGLYRPITPMGMSAFRLLSSSVFEMLGTPVADRLAGAPPVTEAGGRLFFDVTGLIRSRVGRVAFPKVLDVMEARSAKVLRGLFDDPRFGVIQPSLRPPLRRAVRIAARFHIPRRAVRALRAPASAHRDVELLRERLRGRLPAPRGATPAERLDHVERMLGGQIFPLLPTIAPAAAAGFAMLGLAALVLGDRVRPDELETVLRGLPHNVTTEMDLALWRLATRVREDGEAASLLLGAPATELAERFHAGTLPGVLGSGLADFLSVYGVRAVAEIDLGLPRWSEDPTHIIGVLANYLRLEDPALAPDALFARGAAEATLMIKTLGGRAGGLRGRLVRFALGRTRALAGLREMPKYVMVTALAAMRAELLAVGAELASRGLLSRADDVFFLTFREARAALTAPSSREAGAPTADGDRPTPAPAPAEAGAHPSEVAVRPALGDLVARRRAEAARELRRRHVPRVLLSDGTEPEAIAVRAPVDGALTGTPASAGTVTGRARVVLDPVGAHLEPGEILVCPSTDPGWTPLFLTAGGLVMEMGGANSHGAVVAREYGIPAVVGVSGAAKHIVTGQEITVDGASGVVTT